MQLGILEPVFYGDLVYKFKRIVGKSNFSINSKKIIKCYKMYDSLHAWLSNIIKVYSYGFLFNCMMVGHA